MIEYCEAEAYREAEVYRTNGDFKIEYREGYKTYRGFKYHLNFPDEWILDEKEGTGRACWNCVGNCPEKPGFAMWRGIILGYCANCAKDYDGERGCGFIGFGVENKEYHVLSAFDSYLEDVKLDEIGDVSAYPEDTLENHFQLKSSENNRTIPNAEDDDCDVEDLHWCKYCSVSSGKITCSAQYEDDEDDEVEDNINDDGDSDEDHWLPLINGKYIELNDGEIVSIDDLQPFYKVKRR